MKKEEEWWIVRKGKAGTGEDAPLLQNEKENVHAMKNKKNPSTSLERIKKRPGREKKQEGGKNRIG